MDITGTIVDQKEYLHLAMDAVRKGEHGAALSYLKEGVAKFPQDAGIAYLLGAEHAQIGLYDRAEEEMQRAIKLDPSLHTACFQLGLLQMTQARMDRAIETWSGLNSLTEGHALRMFRDGLVALASERYDDAQAFLQMGLAANDFSPDLNRDMERLLSRVSDAAVVAKPEAEQQASHVWFQDYQQPARHK